jgi:cob(I)alamin adenosyltransferase
MIDAAWAGLPEMRVCILPGGGELAARLHVARAVCRRAERDCVALSRAEEIGPWVVIYLNRVSDLLFALARRANYLEGVADVPWEKG